MTTIVATNLGMNLRQLLPPLRFKILYKLKHLVSFKSNRNTLYYFILFFEASFHPPHLTTNQLLPTKTPPRCHRQWLLEAALCPPRELTATVGGYPFSPYCE